MSHTPIDKINYADPNYDAYQRLRTAQATTVFDSTAYYGDEEEFAPAELIGNGTETHLPNESSWELRCTTISGDKVTSATAFYNRYLPGKSHLIMMTGVMEIKTNVSSRIGMCDHENGVFFELADSALGVVVRSNATGSVVNTRIEQANWNIDKLDGTGKSGITLDITKAQVFLIDLQWLGVGRVRYGFSIDGKTIYCHELLNANNISTVYMGTADLPLTYEIENDGAAASDTVLKRICSTVISEGGNIPRGRPRTWNTGVTEVPITATEAPVVSFRLVDPFNGKVNKSLVALTDVQTIAALDSKPVLVTFIKNGTLTGESFVPMADTLMEVDTSATGVTGGVELYTLLISGKSTVQLTQNEDVILTNGDTITIKAVALAGSVDYWGAVNWREQI